MKNKKGGTPAKSRSRKLNNVKSHRKPSPFLPNYLDLAKIEKSVSGITLWNQRCGFKRFVRTNKAAAIELGSLRNGVMENDGDLRGEKHREETAEVYYRSAESEYISRIKRDILNPDTYSHLSLDDVAGMEGVKRVIKEALVLPTKRPDLFRGLRRPLGGVLLFGPPGTGKTFLGKCIASEMRSTLFNVSSTTLTSKWMGEAEMLVRILFTLARCHQPSVIFIDEIDSVLSERQPQESSSTRRMKNEFLVQMDGTCTADCDRVLILGATNRPQELDEAARRRFVVRLYIPLPDEKGRKELLRNLMERELHCLNDKDFNEIARRTNGFSGADLRVLSKEAAMGPIRAIPKEKIMSIHPSEVRPINRNDFQRALFCIKASISRKELKTFSDWNKRYGWECDVKKSC